MSGEAGSSLVRSLALLRMVVDCLNPSSEHLKMDRSREEFKVLAWTVAERYMEELNLAVSNGQDIAQLMRRHEDYKSALMTGWSDEEIILFSEMYVVALDSMTAAQAQPAEFLASQPAYDQLDKRRVDRKAVRKYVLEDSEAMVAAASRGENIHQLSLDQQDRFNEQLRDLSTEDGAALLAIYIEEMEANTHHMNSEVDRINRQTDALNQKAAADLAGIEGAGKAIAVIVSCLVFVFFLVMLSK